PVLWLIRLMTFDPNRIDVEKRKTIGQKRAYHPSDLQALLEARAMRRAARLRCSSNFLMPYACIGGLGRFFVGIGLTIGAARTISLAFQSISWPAVNGTVTRSENVPENPRQTAWHAEIRYEFELNGKTYKSDNLWYGSLQKAEANAKRYPLNSAV